MGTGFTEQRLTSFMADFEKLQTAPAPSVARDIDGVMWIEPKFVCEVIYQEVTKECRLRMPRLHTPRNNKEPSECTIDQIEGKGKCFLC